MPASENVPAAAVFDDASEITSAVLESSADLPLAAVGETMAFAGEETCSSLPPIASSLSI